MYFSPIDNRTIAYEPRLLEPKAKDPLKRLLQEGDPFKLCAFVLQNKDGISTDNPSDLFNDLSLLRAKLLTAKMLEPEIGEALSNIMTLGLQLKGLKKVSLVKEKIVSLVNQYSWEALANWINSEKIPLKWIPQDDLESLAPYLHYVDCKELFLEELEAFILSCSNAHTLYLNSVNIVELKELPSQIQKLYCSFCPQLTLLNVSKLKKLKELTISYCRELTSIDLLKNLQLEALVYSESAASTLDLSKNLFLQCLFCNNCPNLEVDLSQNLNLQTIDFSNCKVSTLNLSQNKKLRRLTFNKCSISSIDLTHNVQLQKLSCNNCNELTSLDLSKNLQLKALDLSPSPILLLDLTHNVNLQELNCSSSQISALDLSNNKKLLSVYFSLCHNLDRIDLSNNPRLQKVICNGCANLTSLGDSLPNSLKNLECGQCPNLTQLPQAASTTTIYSRGSPCGDLFSFRVYPAEIEENPKQVLLNLGKILLQNKPMPNIVFLDEATKKSTLAVDAGGLRRQFVATLCAQLFKENSNFHFIKDEGYDIPTSGDTDALRTFARLLGLSALSPVPTGTNLHPSFFHALFSLTNQELDSISFDQPIPEPPKKKLYMARLGVNESETEEIAEESHILNAIAIVAKELQTILGVYFRPFGKNIAQFMITVQGSKVTKEALKKSISCENTTYKEWIDKFIDSLKTEELKSFLMLLTGSYTLGLGAIRFEVYAERKHLESSSFIHTCSKTMELPGDYTEALLHEELKAQLTLLKSFNGS